MFEDWPVHFVPAVRREVDPPVPVIVDLAAGLARSHSSVRAANELPLRVRAEGLVADVQIPGLLHAWARTTGEIGWAAAAAAFPRAGTASSTPSSGSRRPRSDAATMGDESASSVVPVRFLGSSRAGSRPGRVRRTARGRAAVEVHEGQLVVGVVGHDGLDARRPGGVPRLHPRA